MKIELTSEQLESELNNWTGLVSAQNLGKICLDSQYYPWHTKNFPLFLKSFLMWKVCCLLERIMWSRWLWNQCPAIYRENYLFLYDICEKEKYSFSNRPSCDWPQPSKLTDSNFAQKFQMLLLVKDGHGG